ncbi:cell division protein FtsX [Lachnobacterium bovis]|uniref:cell division protein FtsX n=1 Tax=Lachnobacterium bovis TaxID=140626 RepID=UPI00048CF92E|nr:permease-like cell division protein FtsX [Lachnobacterium bovis]
MKISSTLYSIQQGIKNIWRNKMFSLASIATMSACIFLFGLFYIIVNNFNGMVKDAEENVAITVFFDDGLSKKQIDEIGKKIKKRGEVAKCIYVSKKKAAKDFGKRLQLKTDKTEKNDTNKQNDFSLHNTKDQKNVTDNKGKLPSNTKEILKDALQNSDHYEVFLNDVSMQKNLVNYVKGMDGVRKVNHSKEIAKTLTAFNKLIGYISAGIIIILLGVAVFLISNTVTVGISVRREEIAIMRLIGATDFLIRAPFIVEGIIIGLVGAILPLILLYTLYGKIIGYIKDRFSVINNIVSFIPVGQIFTTLVPVAILLGVGIGLFGSMITIRKHLRV